MPYGIRVFSFGFYDPFNREGDNLTNAEPNRDADAQHAAATKAQDSDYRGMSLGERDIFRRGFFPVF